MMGRGVGPKLERGRGRLLGYYKKRKKKSLPLPFNFVERIKSLQIFCWDYSHGSPIRKEGTGEWLM